MKIRHMDGQWIEPKVSTNYQDKPNYSLRGESIEIKEHNTSIHRTQYLSTHTGHKHKFTRYIETSSSTY